MRALRVNAKERPSDWLCTGSLDEPADAGLKSARGVGGGSGTGTDLVQVVALLGAAVDRRADLQAPGLGSVLGYLAAGLVIGPFGLGCSPIRRRSCTSPSSAS